MFSGSPTYVRFRTYATEMPGRFLGGAGWLVLLPGIALILLALSILVWPELLAYLVASALLFFGVALTAWGWSMMRADRQRKRSMYEDHVVRYREM